MKVKKTYTFCAEYGTILFKSPLEHNEEFFKVLEEGLEPLKGKMVKFTLEEE